MATTLELRRRIKSAQNVSKTTKAMQMISASKLKRAQEAALSSRAYVAKLTSLTRNLAPKKQTIDEETSHPYMKKPASKKTLYIIISPDKGLCGGLVTNLVREYIKMRHDDTASFVTVGKKIEGTIAGTTKNLLAAFPFGNSLPSFDMVYPLVALIDEQFLAGQVSEVKVITTHFQSVFSQKTIISSLLPVVLPEPEEGKTNTGVDFRLFEPSPVELLPALLKRYIEMELFQHLLESYASEQAARMLAMQNATNNAKDIVNMLRLLYNKARQEKITNEILDISSAAVAMENEMV